MLRDWIINKKILPCKYCGGEKGYTKFSKGKIERYGIYCSNCNRWLGWPPNIYKDESEELLF